MTTTKQKLDKLTPFPITTDFSNEDHLIIGGCDTVELVAEFGTPLYLFDELTLRSKCREFKDEFSQRYADTTVIYACKAFINKALALLLNEEGLGLDVVSEGELSIAQSVDFPMDKIYLHGNSKSEEEIRLGLSWRVGRIVVDNFPELKMLGEMAKEKGCISDILLRLSPGVDPHTHQHIITGNINSKFGFPLTSGEEAVREAMSMPNVNLLGLHFHIGSQIAETESYQKAIETILNFAAEMKQKYGFELRELNVGGGVAVQYTLDSPVPPISVYAEVITSNIFTHCQEFGLELPRLVIEPGRSIVGQAGVALYTVGVVKEIPNICNYVSVDGGMADNIRFALYRARHEAVVANKVLEKNSKKFTIVGRFCESGDILIKDINLPVVSAGDVIAIPTSGAYCLPMASNYNASFKPPIVLVNEGQTRFIRRRETLEDITRCDLI